MKRFLFLCVWLGAWSADAAKLPESVVFVGKEKFHRLMEQGRAGNWASLRIGERTARVGKALVGTPYVNFTLELDTRIETPCVNMKGMDCWTFFEISLAAARLMKTSPNATTAEMLRMIELDRYRGGKCDGTFVSRLHHLEDWLQDNERRGLVKDITATLPGAKKLYREMNYMGGSGSRFFRQLRADPSMIPTMRRAEANLSQRGIWYVPKAKVPAVEKLLRDGDVISIVTTWPGSYTSHVGLAVRGADGVLRFMHASREKREVIIDTRLSSYLNRFGKHAGIMVARPNEAR